MHPRGFVGLWGPQHNSSAYQALKKASRSTYADIGSKTRHKLTALQTRRYLTLGQGQGERE